jgi:predicted transcriptional regulator
MRPPGDPNKLVRHYLHKYLYVLINPEKLKTLSVVILGSWYKSMNSLIQIEFTIDIGYNVY